MSNIDTKKYIEFVREQLSEQKILPQSELEPFIV
jgi:hypothetical protein